MPVGGEMKKLLLILGVCAAFNCPAQTADAQDLNSYIASNRPLVDSGQLPWSVYSKEVYSRLVALNAPADILERASRTIRDAELFESGKIDKTEFDYRIRTARAEQASANEARQNAARAQAMVEQRDAEAREQQRSAAVLATAAQLLQNSGPRPLMPVAPGVGLLQATTAVTAFWTGKQQQVQTVTNQFGWSCEYNYAGQTFRRTFVGTCPTSVQVQ